MKKLWVAVLASCAISYVVGQEVATAASPGAESSVALVESAFAATGARVTGFEVHDWTILPQATMSVARLRVLGQGIANELQIGTVTPLISKSVTEASVVYVGTMRFAGESGAVRVTVDLMGMRIPGAPVQTALVIQALANDDGAVSEVDRRVAAAVQTTGATPSINVTMIGLLGKSLATSARAKVIRQSFASVDAREAQSEQDAYTSSVAGCANRIWAPAVRANGQPINLQVALHKRNEFKDTKVLVGSPVITLEY